MPLIDPIELLHRQDKWYLGNGGMLIYAPPFPQWLATPGFWDECHYGDLAVPRLLCLSFALEVPTGGASPSRGEAALRPDRKGDAPKRAKHGFAPTVDGPTQWPAPTGLTELHPQLDDWHWYPDRIEARYSLVRCDGLGSKQQRSQGLTLNETRRILPDGTLSCELLVAPATKAPSGTLHVVAWTARQRGSGERADTHSHFAWDGAALTYTQAVASRAHARGVGALPLRITMQGSRQPDSVQVTPSHGANMLPRLTFTPLWDELKHGKLSGEVVGNNVLGSVVYAGLHWRLPLSAQRPQRLSVYVQVADARSDPVGARLASPSVHTGNAMKKGETSLAPTHANPARAWREFLALVPHFECSDSMLTRYYWYRWYGLRLNAVATGGNYVAPAVAEGIAYFRGVITYSLMCHMQECKWLADPQLAQGCLRNHIAHQTRAGHFPGHIYVNHVNDAGFYHTDVGGALEALLLHHPDAAFAEETRRPLQRLLRYYTCERDEEQLALFDVRDQFETGQEFTSRYFHADRHADLYGWEHALRLKGVDVTYYVYRLARYLERQAHIRGAAAEARRLCRLCERIRSAVCELMWDRRRRYFFDYSAEKGRRSKYWTAVGFYPLLSDLAAPDQALAAAAHLMPGGRFDAPWPTPTVAVDDPYFSADPRWRTERANCPWNGRVWPMVNSHIVGVLGNLAELDPLRFRPQLARYLRRFIEMMHFEKQDAVRVGAAPIGRPRVAHGRDPYPVTSGESTPTKDLARPNCFEHYHPYDGTACEYRGIDDYMHSEVVDPLLKYVAGVRLVPTEGARARLVVDPFPFGLKHLLLTNCHVHGHRLEVCFNRDRRGGEQSGYRVYFDGRLAYRDAAPTPWEVEL